MTAAIVTPANTTPSFPSSAASPLWRKPPAGARRTATFIAVAATILATTLLPVLTTLSSRGQPQPGAAPQVPTSPTDALAGLAPRFEANQGQLDPAVRFVSRGPGYSLFLTANEAVMALGDPGKQGPGASEVVRMRLVGANTKSEMAGADPLAGVSNYLKGNDPSRWVTGVSNYSTVRYHGVYPGIDLVYHGDGQGRVEYDFVVAPGADPRSIVLDFTGGSGLRLEPSGELVIATAAGDLRQRKPTLYQDVAGQRQEVPGRFALKGNQVSFGVGAYDPARPLVIDPVLAYSTYLGGNADDEGTGIAVDPQGFVYVVGTTASTAFPTTDGSDRTCGSGENCQPASDGLEQLPTSGDTDSLALARPELTPRPDAFVTKLTPDGQVVYSTYLGGREADEGLAIAVDASGRAYVAGRTKSPDFPTTDNAYDRTCGTDTDCNFKVTESRTDDPGYGQRKADAFVTKLDAAGTLDVANRAYSTFFGGSGDDTRAGYMVFNSSVLNNSEPGDEIERDANLRYRGASAGIAVLGETVYLASSTVSTDLIKAASAPDSAPGYRPVNAPYDSDCGTGGRGDCNKWVSQCNPLCTRVQQFTDVFVAQLETTLPPARSQEALRYATYLGGSDDDVARGIAAQDVAGHTRLFIVNTPEAEVCRGCGSEISSPPARVDLPSLNTILPQQSGAASLGWSTSIGTRAMAVAVGGAGGAYVTGEVRQGGLVTTQGSFQPEPGSDRDAFVAKFAPSAPLARNAPTVEYATFLGGGRQDVGRGIAVDSAGRVFVTGNTDSRDYSNTTPKDESFPTKDPVQPNSACPTADTEVDCPSNVDAFVVGLDPAKSGGDALIYSTRLGGNTPGPGFRNDPEGRRDEGRAIALRQVSDSVPSIYISGVSNTRDFPLVDPYSNVNTGGSEAFVARLVPGGPQPQVSGVVPSEGPSSGGTAVVVSGSHLGEASAVRFGGETMPCPSPRCTINNSNGTVTLEVVSPPLFDDSSDPTIDIVVVVPGVGTSVRTQSSKFTYHDGRWDPTGAMSGPGKAVTATVLDGPACRAISLPSYCGKALIVRDGTAVDLYDPRTGKWSSETCDGSPELTAPSAKCPNPLSHGRRPPIGRFGPGHTATLLGDGTVLVAGGGGADGAMAELYDPGSGQWKSVGKLAINRAKHTATLLTGPNCGSNCGKVLIVGGTGDVGGQLSNQSEDDGGQLSNQSERASSSTAELYDPQVGRQCAQPTACDLAWTIAGEMSGDRYGNHTATLLSGPNCGSNCGRVLVVGGDAESSENNQGAQPLVELYDPLAPAPLAFTTTANADARVRDATTPRVGHTATLLQGPGCEPHCGKVMLAGGHPGRYGTTATPHRTVELYDPAIADLARAFSHHSELREGRELHSAVLLPGGRLLLTGGEPDATTSRIRRSEVYDPRTQRWRAGPSLERSGPAVLLKGAASVDEARMCGANCGKVLMAQRVGEVLVGATTTSADLYTPAPVVDAIAPSSGPASGGTPLSVTGLGFGGDMGVYFGKTKVCGACVVGSYSSMAASSPPVSDQVSADVWVAREGVGMARAPETFDYTGEPGAVVPFGAAATSDTEIGLSFGAAGSVGTGNPPVKDYIIRQSRSPITASNFDAAPSLCGEGGCHFEPTKVGQMLELNVTKLRPGTHYYYAARAARTDGLVGPVAFADATTMGVAAGLAPATDALDAVDSQVRYSNGYSLVGLPAGTIVNSQSPLYGWFAQGARDSQGRPSNYSTQASDTPVLGGHGYWAWFSTPQLVSLPEVRVSAIDLRLASYQASMVGNPSGTTASTISGHDFTARWDPTLNSGAGGYHISAYQQPQDLARGEGIWAFSYRDTTLRLREK